MSYEFDFISFLCVFFFFLSEQKITDKISLVTPVKNIIIEKDILIQILFLSFKKKSSL